MIHADPDPRGMSARRIVEINDRRFGQLAVGNVKADFVVVAETG